MRISSVFPTLVAVVVVLIFPAPSTSLAQQVPMQTQTKSAAVRNTNITPLETKATAAQDASSDIGNLSDVVLFDPHDPVMRIGCISVGAGLGCLAGCLIGVIDSSGDSRDWMIMGTLVGAVVGGVVPRNYWVFNHQMGPPPKRFLGKSPEYIQFYTDAYRTKARVLQKK